ncbi:hypothetical protein L228DRAFT_245976 [Xylona heveae TC161]|uniref:P-loop containing nucleoside triphosphate hydrolase protein n=1 Tax=Xylona heveae (strain CBS 132557 / TC161) TaxID=1328760 RepID=A0A161TBY4_XYLHT|nr:hypothetical protein L228DRAFT_245976 [Xylona heveae TC161]KZF23237.1 hypothetical protein L228DRAFT_245976 [Xylona heveae TC161]
MRMHKTGTLSAIDGMDNPDRVRILGIVDKLRELGISEGLSLPQLVVVGDQSSGKSSVLEGLTGLSFPVASDLCTRFATQIVLRRTPAAEESVKVSIIPGPTTLDDEEAKDHLLEFEKTFEKIDFDREIFSKILDDAAECMGLPRSTDDSIENLEKRFSDDILKIELCGPEHHHLSVVDVPGLFHNPTKYQTAEDKVIIRDLILQYITDRRTIILAVMDARNNLANQEVFNMARAADPEGQRTAGIITKCDALQPGDEDSVMKIAQNEVDRLTHGWFAVKNRSTQDIKDGVTIEERHKSEKKFFTTAPWNQLRKDRVGIEPLKTFLGQLLYTHVRREFPSLVRDIESVCSSTQKELEALGPPRGTLGEQRLYLTRKSIAYEKSVEAALRGNYATNLPAKDPSKLRMHIRMLNNGFSDRLKAEGHTRAFRTVDDKHDEEFPADDQYENIYDWIRRFYLDSRGAELPGTLNPSVLENLFREQSTKWAKVAFNYLEDVEKAVLAYNDAIFSELIPEEDVRQKLRTRLDSESQETIASARRHLKEILSDERDGILQTENHYFSDTLNSIREDRVSQRLQSEAFSGHNTLYNVDLSSIMRTVHLSNEDQSVYEIHDTLKTYYKVAIKRFVDNVIMQVVERHFLRDGGSIKKFSPEFVNLLDDADLSYIAGENYSTASARVDIKNKIERFQKALELAHGTGI